MILAVTEVNGCRYSAWVHEAWQAVLGPPGFAGAPTEVQDAVLAYARACAEAGRPLDPAALNVTLPAAAVRAVRVAVASTELTNLVGVAADRLQARLTGRGTRSVSAMAREAATLTLAAPLAMPFLALGGALRLLDRFAPDLPAVERPDPDDSNLLSHLLVEAVPGYLGHASCGPRCSGCRSRCRWGSAPGARRPPCGSAVVRWRSRTGSATTRCSCWKATSNHCCGRPVVPSFGARVDPHPAFLTPD